MESIIAAAVTGGLALLGVIITNISSNRKMENQMAINQAVTNEKIENLTKEVTKHNSFAERLPVVEEQIKVVNHRVDDLKIDIENLKKKEVNI